LERVALDAFVAAAQRGLTPKPIPEVETDHVAPIRASVRDAIETVLALLPEHGTVRFRDLTIGSGAKLEVIVRFLAVLELFKQGIVDLEQVETFGELVVRPLPPGERVSLDLSSLVEWGDDEAPAVRAPVDAPAPVEATVEEPA
jgi:segregation and condensation protein A